MRVQIEHDLPGRKSYTQKGAEKTGQLSSDVILTERCCNSGREDGEKGVRH